MVHVFENGYAIYIFLVLLTCIVRVWTVTGLQNDYKDIMKEIEEGLYQIHAEARQKKEETAMEVTTPTTDDQQSRLSPFLVIEKVDEGSPAHTCVNW